MRTTVSITGLIVLGALAAFLAGTAGAEDDSPAPPAAGPRAEADRPPGAGMAARAADADRDGAVTADEWKAFTTRLQKTFAELDKNGDGALSTDEMPRRPRGRRGPGMRRGARGGPEHGRMARHRPDDRRGPPPHAMGGQGQGRRGPPPHARGGQGQGRRGPPPHAMGGQGQGRRGPPPHAMGGQGQGRRGPPPHARGGQGQGRRGPPPQGTPGKGQGHRGPPADLGPKLDRLTAALEKLIERLETDGAK